MKIKIVSSRQVLIVSLMSLLMGWTSLLWLVFLQIPYWRVSFSDLAGAFILGAVLFGVAAASVLRLKRTLLTLWWLMGAASALILFSVSFLYRNPSLGFATVAWCAFVYLVGLLYRAELARSFWPPAVSWYQGRPESVPELRVVLQTQPEVSGCLNRFDEEGLFAVLSSPFKPKLKGSRSAQPVKARVEYRGQGLELSGRVSCIAFGNQAIGLRFESPGADAAKDVLDFVEKVRSEGHLHV